MKKPLTILILLLITRLCNAGSVPTQNPNAIWQGVIILEDGTLNKYALNDLPGSICLLIPEADGKKHAYLLGNKVLKNETNLPPLNATPTPLISTDVSGDIAANLSYLSFASLSLGKTNDVRFTATETANSEVLDSQIDWTALTNRVAEIKQQNSNMPSDVTFGVVRVASILTISYQTFTGVNSAGKISGWGFSGGGTYLSQASDLQNTYVVGVSLSYPPDFFPVLSTNFEFSTENPLVHAQVKEALEKAVNIGITSQLQGSKATLIQNIHSSQMFQ